ncbi:MAG TPA: hypothetical protein VKK31_24245 [Thermoanaerobaculia bacterium]|nr:hypothetical protein [Thermoanaerobaculia bacterium]
MRLATAFAAYELRTQARSLRFRVLAAAYAVAGSTPGAICYTRNLSQGQRLGGASYAAELMTVLPALTAILAFLVSLDGILREQEERSWSTVSLASMSSAGYLVRRWLALQTVLVPLTAVPFLATAAAAAAANGPGAVTAGPLVVPWLLHILPLALATSALAVGLGTIAGGTVNAFLLAGLVLALVPPLVNSLLGYAGLRLAEPLAWIDLRNLLFGIQRMTNSLVRDDVFGLSFPLQVSESSYDAGVAADQYLAGAAVPSALALATLGLAVFYLRRTRPDVRPLRIGPRNPLRNFLGLIARLRERYTPDPVPARADLLALGLALAVTLGSSAWILDRGQRFQSLGEERYAAETSGPLEPTPNDVVPGRWRIEGTVGPGRQVSLAVTAEMRNTGTGPRGHLGFELNPFLRIVSAEAGEGRLTLSRRWDRVAVEVSPPIPPGGRRELRFRLAGEPAQAVFSLEDHRGGSFYKVFYGHLHARFGRELSDLSRSHTVPAISERRIELAAASLTPVPRYSPWKLNEEREVPEESFLPPAEASLSLAVPPDRFVADACGGIARAGRLESRCRLSPAELVVAGGRYEVLPGTAGGATVAVYPYHADLGRLHLGFLTRGTARVEEAWPGLGDLRGMVVMEWPEDYVHELDTTNKAWMRLWDDPRKWPVGVRGKLVLPREVDLIRTRPLEPDTFIAELVTSRLTRRRILAPADAVLFRQLFRALALQRLGLGDDSGAVVMGLRTGMESTVRIPPPEESYATYWDRRFPALVAALRSRMGEEPLRRAVEELLSRNTGEPASRAELYALLAERSEAPLGRMIEDFFVHGLLPELALDGVALRRTGAGWQVSGRMLNQGTGEALCKVVLTTDLGPVETTARAGTGEAGAFSITTAHRPQAVWIDPDRQCHRLVRGISFADRFYFEGNGR